MVYARALRALECITHAGPSPALGTKFIKLINCDILAPENKMTETLRDICKANGCIWAITSTGEVEGTPPKGEIYCYWLLDPEQTKSEEGCASAAIIGPMAHVHGEDIRYGVMKKSGFTENTDHVNAPPDHPIKR